VAISLQLCVRKLLNQPQYPCIIPATHSLHSRWSLVANSSVRFLFCAIFRSCCRLWSASPAAWPASLQQAINIWWPTAWPLEGDMDRSLSWKTIPVLPRGDQLQNQFSTGSALLFFWKKLETTFGEREIINIGKAISMLYIVLCDFFYFICMRHTAILQWSNNLSKLHFWWIRLRQRKCW